MDFGCLQRAITRTLVFLVFAAVVSSGQFPILTALFGPLMDGLIGSRADSLSASWMTWRAAPESSADAACKGLWVDMARNDMALRCYATTDISRFCNSTERTQFGWLVARYVQDERVFNQTLLSSIVLVALANARQASSGKDSPATVQIDPALAAQIKELRDSGFLKAMKLPVLRDGEVTALIQNLASKGYIHRNDMAWHLPTALEKGFSDSDPPDLPANCSG